jgi:F-type H+-transporting ATPase subunit a
VTFFVGILELIGEFAKIASLSFRLFGNIFAGEVLLVSMGALLAYGLPIPFLFLEIFVGLIQAFIFAILVLVYFTIASQDHEEHEKHGEYAKAMT